MNTDDKILKILEELQADVKGLSSKVDNVDQGQKALQTDVASVRDIQQKQGEVQQKQGKHIDMLLTFPYRDFSKYEC